MKNLLKDVDTIIFDNDGTLFQADLISFPAVVSAYKDLMKIHQVKLTIPSKNEINSHIGLPAKEYFKNLLPVELQKWSDQFEQMCVQHEIFNIQKGLGSLYDGVEETLIELKKRNFRLSVITNAGVDYFNAVVDYFHYHRFFDAYICLGDRPHLTKDDLLKEILDHFKTNNGAIVGDKKSDINAGKRHNCLTIAALYGYGTAEELENADEKIKNFPLLLELFN